MSVDRQIKNFRPLKKLTAKFSYIVMMEWTLAFKENSKDQDLNVLLLVSQHMPNKAELLLQ